MRHIFLKKADPGVSVVCFRVGAGSIEHAFHCVCGTGNVGAAFDAGECWSDQDHQDRDDADYNEKLYESKSPRALKAFAGDAAVLRRGKPLDF